MSMELEAELPSGGVIYGGKMPGGKVHITRFKMGLAEKFAAGGGTVDQRINEMVSTCLKLPPDMKYDELAVTDRHAVLIYQRVHSYGPMQKLDWKCPSCAAQNSSHINIHEQFEENDVAKVVAQMRARKGYENFEYAAELTYVLPTCKVPVSFRQLLVRDEEAMKTITKQRAMSGAYNADAGDTDPRIRLNRQLRITKIGDKVCDTLTAAEQLWDGVLAGCDPAALDQDVYKLTRFMDATETGVDTRAYVKCINCTTQHRMGVPMNEEFFRPSEF